MPRNRHFVAPPPPVFKAWEMPTTCINGYSTGMLPDSAYQPVPVVARNNPNPAPGARSLVPPNVYALGDTANGGNAVPSRFIGNYKPLLPACHALCQYCRADVRGWTDSLLSYPGLSAALIAEENATGHRVPYEMLRELISTFHAYGAAFSRCVVAYADTRITEVWEAERYAEELRRHAQTVDRQREQHEYTIARQIEMTRSERTGRAKARARNATKRILVSESPKDPTRHDVAACFGRSGSTCCTCEVDEDGECEDRCSYCLRHDGDASQSPDHGTPFYAAKGVKNRRLVGLEIEYNNSPDLSKWMTKWRGSVHSDGSCGWEAVTTPIAGGHIDHCITDLAATLAEQSAAADDRCGVHVHVDAYDVAWADMIRLLRVYTIVEPLLYLIGGQQRLNGRYCSPCAKSFSAALSCQDLKGAILSAAYSIRDSSGNADYDGRERQRERPAKKDGGRYKGINIVPWLVGRRNGKADTTIEFRMHRNCLNAKRLIGWTHLLADLVEYATTATDSDVAALPKSALRVLCKVSPRSQKWIVRRVLEWRRVTTPIKSHGVSDVVGSPIPVRRISVSKGVFACAV